MPVNATRHSFETIDGIRLFVREAAVPERMQIHRIVVDHYGIS